MSGGDKIRTCFLDIGTAGSQLQKKYCDVLDGIISDIMRPGTEVTVLPKKSIFDFHYPAHSPYAGVDMLHNAIMAEKDGYDVIIIGCWLDPGLSGAKENCSVPVIGVGEAAMHLASMRNNRFGIVRMDDASVPCLENNIANYGLDNRTVAVRPVRSLTMAASEIQGMFDDPAPILERFHAHANELVESGADLVFPGCTPLGMLCHDNGVRKVDGTGIPVADPVSPALKLAEAMADMGKLDDYPVFKGGM